MNRQKMSECKFWELTQAEIVENKIHDCYQMYMGSYKLQKSDKKPLFVALGGAINKDHTFVARKFYCDFLTVDHFIKDYREYIDKVGVEVLRSNEVVQTVVVSNYKDNEVAGLLEYDYYVYAEGGTLWVEENSADAVNRFLSQLAK